MKIYPNPIENGILKLQNQNIADSNYSIFDVSGKLIGIGKIQAHQIEVTQLKAGTYLLLLRNGQNTMRQKFIIK